MRCSVWVGAFPGLAAAVAQAKRVRTEAGASDPAAAVLAAEAVAADTPEMICLDSDDETQVRPACDRELAPPTVQLAPPTVQL